MSIQVSEVGCFRLGTGYPVTDKHSKLSSYPTKCPTSCSFGSLAALLTPDTLTGALPNTRTSVTSVWEAGPG